MSVSFLIADDHPMVRAGLISLVSLEFPDAQFFQAGPLEAAQEILDQHPIHCALLDYKMGDDHVLSLLPHIQLHHKSVKVLVISMMDAREIGALCIRAGAHGFLHKTAAPEEVLSGVKAVLSGRIHASIEVSRALMKSQQENGSLGCLTRREMEVFSLLGEGLKVGEIAPKLGISVKTVEAHRDHIKNKLGIETAAQLMIRASKWLDEQCH